jgi:hypothetical protein
MDDDDIALELWAEKEPRTDLPISGISRLSFVAVA